MGATAKVTDLQQKYPELIGSAIEVTAQDTSLNKFELNTSNRASSESLDLATVNKASQAISSEIDFDRLLIKLVKIATDR